MRILLCMQLLDLFAAAAGGRIRGVVVRRPLGLGVGRTVRRGRLAEDFSSRRKRRIIVSWRCHRR